MTLPEVTRTGAQPASGRGDPSPRDPESPWGGEALRQARERAGLSLEAAAAKTRITSTYLRALEEDAPPDVFPAPVYARFFTRAYATLLGLDPEPLLRCRDALSGGPEQEGPDLGRVPLRVSRGPRRLTSVVVAAASVLILGGLGLTSVRPQGGEAPPSLPSPDTAAAAPAPAPDEEPQVAGDGAAGYRGVHAVLRLSAPSWVEAVVDGEAEVRETLPEARRVVLRARRDLELVLGNAGGVRLRVNGERVATGQSGEVVRLSFAWRDGALRRP